jgi:spermidine synthase
MGHTVAAVSTVLAAVLGGMALGALLAGRLASQRTRPGAVRLYGWLELAVGASALLVPVFLGAFDPLLTLAYADGEGGMRFGLVRLATSLLVIGLPAAAMGATFPVAARAIVEKPERAGRSGGGLYAANTVGAAAGAAAAAFLLLPSFGLSRTTWIAAGLNLGAATIAFVAARRWPDEPPPVQPHKPAGKRRGTTIVPNGRPGLAAFALAITGCVALANEVVWTRVLALVVGPTTYAFGAMLAIFIAGLAAGSAVSALVADRIRRPRLALGLVMVGVAGAPLLAMGFVEPWTLRVAEVIAGANVRFADAVKAEALAAATLLLPTTVALGAAFPLGLRVAVGPKDSVPRNVSLVYAANTAGAIAGSLGAGFVLIPAVGLQRALMAASCLALMGAAAVLAAGAGSRRSTAIVGSALAVGAAIVWTIPVWDMTLLSSGAYKYAPLMRGPDIASTLRAGTVLFHREGAAGTVSVRRVAGTLSMSIDGKVDASNGGDMLTQKLLAHLPLLLHERPSRVGIIGLGSGVTLGAALAHPIERADVVEISPEVVSASAFFKDENHNALSDRRTRLIVGDGRTHILLNGERYDVLVSEPSNPWMAGVAALFTREFFEGARRALTEDGIFCQWAHTYDMADADLRSIAATFRSIFPDGTMWLVGAGDLLFLGSPAGITSRLDGLGAALDRPRVAADLREVDVLDADSLLSLYIGGPEELRLFAQGAPVQSDDRMALEFSAPRNIVGRGGSDNTTGLLALARVDGLPDAIKRARTTAAAPSWRNRGTMLQNAEAPDRAFDAFARAVELDPTDATAVSGLVEASGASGRGPAARQLLAELADRRPEDPLPRIELSRLLAAESQPAAALDAIQPAMVTFPDDPRPFEQAASVLSDAGDAGRLRDVVLYMRQKWPMRAATRYYEAALSLQEGRPADAVEVARSVLASGTEDARVYNLVGIAEATLGRRDEARRAFEQALAKDPRDASVYVNLGLVALETGDAVTGRRWFAEALVLDPDSAAAREGLARAESGSGKQQFRRSGDS